jgi:hypothetical protein
LQLQAVVDSHAGTRQSRSAASGYGAATKHHRSFRKPHPLRRPKSPSCRRHHWLSHSFSVDYAQGSASQTAPAPS